MSRPSDWWQALPASWGSMAYECLGRVQDSRRSSLSEGVRFLPMLAASHLAASRSTALSANRAGFHAVALALARQALESLTVIEVGLLGPSVSSDLLRRWQVGKLKHGDLRKRLAESSWLTMPQTPWNTAWLDHMAGLAKVLQPYAHYSPELLQWNFALVERPTGEEAVAAIGHGTFDNDKAERLALLLGVFLWNLLVVLEHYADLPQDAVRVKEQLDQELARTPWLDAGRSWHDQLIPHVWFPE